MSWLIGRTNALIDRWSAVHVSSGVVLGSAWEANFNSYHSGHWWMHLIWFALAFPGWELLESYLEKKHPETFRGRCEVWYNRWISDGLMVAIGGAVGIWVVGS